uniref:E3 ubiquitin-protein ligase synoviolin-like TPR repeats domain-containing protein n=1 Tax=Bos mutus grunniens TaxID=30521 RepID=A0A8B9YSS3_BOSMU
SEVFFPFSCLLTLRLRHGAKLARYGHQQFFIFPCRSLGQGNVPNCRDDGGQPGADRGRSGSCLLPQAPVLPHGGVPDQVQSQHGSPVYPGLCPCLPLGQGDGQGVFGQLRAAEMEVRCSWLKVRGRSWANRMSEFHILPCSTSSTFWNVPGMLSLRLVWPSPSSGRLQPRFVALFTLLLFLKCFHWLAEDRVDFMERSPNISWLFHCRIVCE